MYKKQLQKYIKLYALLLAAAVMQLCALSESFAANQMHEIDIYIKDHKFEPDIVEVPSGTKLRVTVHNTDSTIEEFDSPDLKREKIIPGGSKARIILAPLKVGEYHFVGEFHEETAKGKFVVKDKVLEEASLDQDALQETQ